MARIGIVGAGIVGLGCAHHLMGEGHQVTLVDQDPRGDKCSWGNAGGIGVTEVVPASVPGLVWRVPRWLIDPLGPLSLRPAHAPRMLPWLSRFLAEGRPARVQAVAAALASLNLRAVQDTAAFLAAAGLAHAMRRAGALTVYETRAAYEAERGDWELRRRLGIACDDVSAEEAHAMEPALGANIRYAVHAPDWHQVTDPKEIWAGVLDSLLARGVALVPGKVTEIKGRKLRLASGEVLTFDQVVVAAGAWSARLARSVGDRALLESERGYNTTLPAPGISLSREVAFGDHKFVAAPLSCGLRIGGAAEFAGLEARPNFARSRALLALARRYFPNLSDAGGTMWMGNRPTTPDTLPVIGRSPRRPEVVYAFGHGHLGLTQAATTGHLVADIIADRDSGLDLAPFSISRFGRS